MKDFLKELQFNIREESGAIEHYIDLLYNSKTLDIENKDSVISEIEEIISDELNHIDKLYEIFVLLSGIEPNKE